MSKSQIYEDFTDKYSSSRILFDFLLNNNSCAENAEMAIKVTVSFTVDGEHIEFPIPSRLSYQQIQHILDMTGNSFEDFMSFAIEQIESTKDNL